jgi:hypothetical protein
MISARMGTTADAMTPGSCLLHLALGTHLNCICQGREIDAQEKARLKILTNRIKRIRVDKKVRGVYGVGEYRGGDKEGLGKLP